MATLTHQPSPPTRQLSLKHSTKASVSSQTSLWSSSDGHNATQGATQETQDEFAMLNIPKHFDIHSTVAPDRSNAFANVHLAIVNVLSRMQMQYKQKVKEIIHLRKDNESLRGRLAEKCGECAKTQEAIEPASKINLLPENTNEDWQSYQSKASGQQASVNELRYDTSPMRSPEGVRDTLSRLHDHSCSIASGSFANAGEEGKIYCMGESTKVSPAISSSAGPPFRRLTPVDLGTTEVLSAENRMLKGNVMLMGEAMQECINFIGTTLALERT